MNEVQVLEGRQVPLGGLRALKVRRTLPHKDRSFVGSWCFLDHYGPEPVKDARDGMNVPPHPHTGLQTVSWLFDGVIEHRDSGGVHALVRPGEMNLMTSGHGIAHSEVSTKETEVLHGVQLWVALPDDVREGPRNFEHYVPQPSPLPDGGEALVFIGSLIGVADSPVHTYTPLLGAELRLLANTTVTLDVDPGFEHALLVDSGDVTFAGQPLKHGDLGCVEPGGSQVVISVSHSPARLIFLGGEPFTEEIVMWWNFVGRSHEDVARDREEYEAASVRFGVVEGYRGAVDRIPAPPLPPVHLRPRSRRGRR